MALISDEIRDLKNRQLKIDSTQNGQMVEFYTPSQKYEIPLDGFIFEMRLDIKIRSVTEMPRQEIPSQLLTEKEKDDLYWESVKDVPAKLVDFYSSTSIDPEPLYRFGLLLFNINPSYSESILNGFTDQQYLSVAFGSKLYYKISNYNSGEFGEGDALTLFLDITEYANVQILTYARSSIPSSILVQGPGETIIAASNNRRASLAITNSGENICYLSAGTPAIAGSGKALPPKTCFEINRSNYTNKQIYAACLSGKSTILDVEEAEF